MAQQILQSADYNQTLRRGHDGVRKLPLGIVDDYPTMRLLYGLPHMY